MEYLLFILLGIIFLLFRSSRFKGYVGESKVISKINSLVSENGEYKTFHDVILQTPDGSTQIDHILISPYGIFVIETKNLTGWIFGSADQKTWTQTIYRNKFKFQNPLHQNFKHVRAVQSLLNADTKKIFSIVVFVGNSNFRTVMPDNVVKLRDLVAHLKSYAQQILSNESVEKYSEMLRDAALNVSITQRGHVRNIKQNMTNPICPRCGKPMVLRTARKGREGGPKFWGCSGYPACKATKKVA